MTTRTFLYLLLPLPVLFFLAMSLLCTPLQAHAIETAQAQTIHPVTGQLTLDFEDVDIRTIVRFMAEATGRNFIVDNKVVGKVTLISPRPVDKNAALGLFENLLAASGYAIVPAGDALRILPLSDAGKEAVTLVKEKETARPGQVVTRLVRLKQVSANTIIPVLKPLLSGNASLSAYLPANTLILTENYANIERLSNLIAELDKNIDKQSRSIDIFYLKNAESKSLALVLNEMIKNAGKEGTSNPQGIELAAFRGPVNVVAEESTNALILSAEPSDMSILKDVIGRLDIRRLQVFIEAMIMEVSADLTDQFGVEWRSAANLSAATGITPFGGQTFGSGIAQLSDNPLNLPNGFAFGVAGGNITFRGQEYANIGLLVRALRSDQNVNILSTPQLLTLDNEQAEIIVGDNVPFITGSFDLNNGNQNPFQTIERQDVGLTLRIRPQISEDGFIRMNIYQEISSLASQGDAADIVTRKRSIKTTVVVPDRQMVVLGGLIREDVTQNHSQVPCLASFMGAGELFKNTSLNTAKTNLMVFIKPHIINAYGKMDAMTKEKYHQMRNLQLDRPRGESKFVDFPAQEESDMVPEHMRIPAPPAQEENEDDSDTSEEKEQGDASTDTQTPTASGEKNPHPATAYIQNFLTDWMTTEPTPQKTTLQAGPE